MASKRVIISGNPRKGSRTTRCAVTLDRVLHGRSENVRTVELSDGERTSRQVQQLVEQADVLVVASPVFKGAITGLLKSAFDAFPPGTLNSMPCIPLMLGASAGHSLAVRYSLVPLLAELGGFVLPELYVTEGELADGGDWAVKYRDLLLSVNGVAFECFAMPE